jgi:hypothetical protein
LPPSLDSSILPETSTRQYAKPSPLHQVPNKQRLPPSSISLKGRRDIW